MQRTFQKLVFATIAISWSPNPATDNVTGYSVRLSHQDGSVAKFIEVGPVTAVSVPDDDPSIAKVFLVARNAVGDSDPSQPALVSRPVQTPTPAPICQPVCPDELVFHPNGSTWRANWCHAREWGCSQERDLFKCRKKKWAKCSAPFIPECVVEVSNHLP